MVFQRNFKYRIYPTPEQEKILLGWERTLRDLWNCAHQQRLMGLKRSEKIFVDYFQQAKEMTQCLEEFPWISEIQCQARQQVLMDLDKAWKSCFLKVGKRPRFKDKSSDMRIFIPVSNVPVKLTGSRTNGIISFNRPSYRKLGPLKIAYHRPTPGKVTSWSLKRENNLGEWYAIACCEIEQEIPAPINDQVVGLDRGVANFLADSEGKLTPNVKAREQLASRLARAQREAARKIKGSANQKKAYTKVAKLMRQAARQRAAVCHDASKKYASNYGTVVIEKLNIAGMTKSAKGTLEKPGKNVKAKSGLNRVILDIGWGMFANQLKYKAVTSGNQVVEVSAHYTSQTCPQCQYISLDNRKTQSYFKCVSCGYSGNADVIAAVNIKQRGINILSVAPPPKVAKKISLSRQRKKKTTVEPTVVQPEEVTLPGSKVTCHLGSIGTVEPGTKIRENLHH